MNIKIFGILGLIAFATAPAVAVDDSDYVEYEDEYDDYNEYDEYEDEYEYAEDEVEEPEISIEEAIVNVPVPRAVVQRMTCDEINERVFELQQDVKVYPDMQADLEYMLSRQRAQCAPRANRRPVHNYNNVNPVRVEEFVEIEPEVVEEVAPEPEPVVVQKTPEELAAEKEALEKQRAENMVKGLCVDGTKPNRYGCCAGEKFQEVSRMTFECCPIDGDWECHEPLKRK